jgi:hypothetical protein
MENNFETIWARIKEETGLKNLKNLADLLEISQPAVSEMKGKGKFPPGWAYLVAKKHRLLTEWIMTGEGPKRIEEGIELNPLLIDVNEWLNEERKHKDAGFRTLFRQQMIRAFFDYEAWVKKRKVPLESGHMNPKSKVA